jgi:YHS domain-containing protein
MKVAKQNPRGTYEYQGETYLFCSPGCLVPPEQKGRAIDRRHTSI